MKKYFLHNGNDQEGPFDTEQLRTKNLSPDTPIWFDGLTEWTTVGNVDELKELIVKKTPPPFNPPIKQTTAVPQNNIQPKALTNAEVVGNEMNAKYKCEWCNTTHNEQFLVCSVCHKRRKDIWWDDLRAMSYLISGIVLSAIGGLVFYINRENSDFVLSYGWLCVTVMLLGMILMIVGAVYNQRTKKKLKITDFD